MREENKDNMMLDVKTTKYDYLSSLSKGNFIWKIDGENKICSSTLYYNKTSKI